MFSNININYIIALTGGICSGKSTIANIFHKLGIKIVDVDRIARNVIQNGTPEFNAIINKFGLSILLPDGSLDRKKLKIIICKKQKNRIWLNNLLHPVIRKHTNEQINVATKPYLIWVIPLLIENNLQNYANRILAIDIKQNIQINRIKIRDNLNKKQAKRIINTQTNNKNRLFFAHDIIKNHSNIKQLTNDVLSLHNFYLKILNIQ